MINLDIWGKTVPIEGSEDAYYPLLGHMLDTVVASAALYDNWLREGLRDYLSQQFGSSEVARSMITLAAGLHDIGKCSPVFQGELLNPRGQRHGAQVERLKTSHLIFPSMDDVSVATARKERLNRHEKIGYWLLTDGDRKTKYLLSESWLQTAVLGHHGLFAISYGNPRVSNQLGLLSSWIDESWIEQVKLHIQAVEEASRVTLEQAKTFNISHEAVILIAGLIVLADRLASNTVAVEQSYSEMNKGNIDLLYPQDYVTKRYPYLKELASKEVGFPVRLDRKDILGDYKPRGVQLQVPKNRGLWTVMAPTGAGKTEAALLRHSEYLENMIFLLPTKSTTDAMFERLRNTYKNVEGIKVGTLAHGDAYLNNFYQQARGYDLDTEHDGCGEHLVPSGLTNAGARLSAPISVATIDQMVMGGLPAKWSHLRLLTLANSHIIMDEAHLLDSYQINLIEELLGFLGAVDTRVTVLSATMPSKLKQKIASGYLDRAIDTKSSFPSEELFPGRRAQDIQVDNYRVSLEKTIGEPVDSHINWAKKIISINPRARLGIFVNTVNSCQTIADLLRRDMPDVRVICLHSRMLAAHRKKIVDDLLLNCGTNGGTAERVILVGTQVIEMSLDIDLDLISTDICPAPSLIQRFGRAWRDKSSEAMIKRSKRINLSMTPELTVHIAIADDPDPKRNPYLPYSKSLIGRSLSYLEGRDLLYVPEDVQAYVETTTINYGSLSESFADQEEIAEDILKQMKANDIRSKISDFRDADTTVAEATMLTASEIEEELMTRLIDGNIPPFVLVSSDSKLQNLGALPLEADIKTISELEIKSASVAVSRQIEKRLKDFNVEPLKIGKRTFGFFGELPEGVQYDYLIGLVGVK